MIDPAAGSILAARLLRPQGRRGELLAEPEVAVEVFTPGRGLRLVAPVPTDTPDPTEVVLESAWQPTGRNAGRIVLKLSGIDSINSAEALSGYLLYLQVADLPPLPPDTFRVRDLIGCELFNGDQLAGTVVNVEYPVAADGRTRLVDAPDLLAITPVHAPEEADPILIPFAQAWLIKVDIPARRIEMNLPEGLLTDPA